MLAFFTRYPLALPLMAALAALAFAFVSEYGFGLRPCEMCWWQRYPYMAAAALALAGWRAPRLIRPILLISALLFALDAGLAAYHAGVEWGWFEGPAHCTGGGEAGASLDALRRSILSKPLALCNQPAFVLLGLSMAGWNAVYAASNCLATIALHHYYAIAGSRA